MSSTAMSLRQPSRVGIRQLSGILGAELTGLDLSHGLDDETFKTIEQAVLNHLVVIIPDQKVDTDFLEELGARFGALNELSFIPKLKDRPHVEFIERVRDGKLPTYKINWHVDFSYTELGSKIAILHALEVPPVGGGTVYANMYMAYDSLSDHWKSFLSGLEAEHDILPYAIRYWGAESLSDAKHINRLAQYRESMPAVWHPIVRTHPDTGRKLLFVNESFCTRIKGMKARESDAVLKFLFEHVSRHDFTHRLSVQPGQILIWDNRSTQHTPIADYVGRRVLHRVSVMETRRPA
jgi:taurine dioxygenase